MTTNQRRAVALAHSIRDGRASASALCDADWMLLLLAAGLNNFRTLPPAVADRVVDHARRGVGYFAGAAGRPGRGRLDRGLRVSSAPELSVA